MARTPEYARLVAAVRELVESEIPKDAQVLVATRGDDGLLGFDGRSGWHFPREPGGKYAGYHPADSEAAISHLEELRAQGATHLVLPETAFWWLAYYEGLREHLERSYRTIASDEHAIVYDLAGDGIEPGEPDVEVSSELIRTLQPSSLGAASRYRNGDEDATSLGARRVSGRQAAHGRAHSHHDRSGAGPRGAPALGSARRRSTGRASSDR